MCRQSSSFERNQQGALAHGGHKRPPRLPTQRGSVAAQSVDDRLGLMMSDHSDDSEEDKGNAKKSVKVVCSRHGGLDAHRHEQVKHAREIEAALAGMGLLLTAQGGMPARLELIGDATIATSTTPSSRS